MDLKQVSDKALKERLETVNVMELNLIHVEAAGRGHVLDQIHQAALKAGALLDQIREVRKMIEREIDARKRATTIKLPGGEEIRISITQADLISSASGGQRTVRVSGIEV